MPDVKARIAAVLADDPPLNPHAGGLIRTGHDATVDELRGLSQHGKQWITQLETTVDRVRTGAIVAGAILSVVIWLFWWAIGDRITAAVRQGLFPAPVAQTAPSPVQLPPGPPRQ